MVGQAFNRYFHIRKKEERRVTRPKQIQNPMGQMPLQNIRIFLFGSMFFPPGPLKWGSTSWTHWSSKRNLAQDFARQRLGPQGSEKTCPSGDSLTRPCGSTGHSPHCLAAHWNHKSQRNKLGNGGCHVKLHLLTGRTCWHPTGTSNSSFEATLSMGPLYSVPWSTLYLKLSESPWQGWGGYSPIVLHNSS